MRDWLHVHDHCTGIVTAMERGSAGGRYNIGGGNERHNLDIVLLLLELMDAPRSLIQHVETDSVTIDATRFRRNGCAR